MLKFPGSIVSTVLGLALSLSSCQAWGSEPIPTTVETLCQVYDCGQLLPGAEEFRPSSQASLPVVEAFRAGKVFAYIFLSTDLANIPAYSGKPLVTLIAMDSQGIILNSQVVHHSEPILLVGIPESVLDVFLEQYQGRHIAQRSPLMAPYIESAKSSERPVNMITGATVTALVLEETLLGSAREVGLALGMIEGGGKRRITWHTAFEPKSWQELESEGSIGHLRVEAREMDPQGKGDKPWIDLYFGDVTQPVIGRNVLGEITYQWLQDNLKPGQHALFIVASGSSSFKGSGFVRGGIFDRIHLEQGLNTFSFKDLDYENLYGVKASGAPRFTESGLFFLRDKRFDPSSPWDFVLLASRLTGETATSKVFKSFATAFHLPGKYYEVEDLALAEKRARIWAIWKNNAPRVALLLVLLLAGFAAFFARSWLTARARRLEIAHIGIMAASVLIVGVLLRAPPSVTQLFPFVRVFEDGLRMDLFLSDPLLFIFWVFIGLSLLLWGRGWFCGWICPYGALLELVHIVSKKVLPKKALLEFPDFWHEHLRKLRYLLLVVLMTLAVTSLEWAERLAEIEPFKTTWLVGVFNRDWYLTVYWWGLLLIAVFNFRFFCRYLCPLGAALSLGSVLRVIGIRRKEFCTRCKICARNCESRAIDSQGNINRYECLSCLECEEKYSNDRICPPLVIARRQIERAARAANEGTGSMEGSQ